MKPAEKILVVESDSDISDLVARQVLEPLGYQVKVVNDATSAINLAVQFSPDLVVTNLNLPGLSGKDLLIALTSQGLETPLIVIAEKGQENNIIQAFRLGASDYLLWPAREAEILAAVERSLKQIREKHTRRQLDEQLGEADKELQRRVRELTTLFALGKAVLSITDQRALFEKVIEGAMSVSEADYGWLLTRDERTKTYLLIAHQNLPDAWAKKMNQPLDDGISSLVALSGETLTINGEPLKRFKVANLGQSAVAVPIKVQQEVIGLLVVVRKADQPFNRELQTLLEVVADYTSISLVNARLFRALQETAEAAQDGERRQKEELKALKQEIQDQLQPITYPIDLLLTGKTGKLNDEQEQALKNIQAALQRVFQIIATDKRITSKANTPKK